MKKNAKIVSILAPKIWEEKVNNFEASEIKEPYKLYGSFYISFKNDRLRGFCF